MKYKINQNFKVIVFPNKLNDLVKKDTIIEYNNNELISDKSSLKFKVLDDINNGDLLPDVEYQIIATIPMLVANEAKDKFKFIGPLLIEINEFSELEGLNPISYPFLTVIE